MINNLHQPKDEDISSNRMVKVLICDDEPRIREALQSLLTTYGLSKPDDKSPKIEVVGNAANGREAIQMVEKFQPDVVLMDAFMPVMNGLEATRAIKAIQPQVRVIMLTLYSELQRVARIAGADAFLVKGCPAETLIDTILPVYKTDTGYAG
jgi:YesN/AraC family two-component response regulator